MYSPGTFSLFSKVGEGGVSTASGTAPYVTGMLFTSLNLELAHNMVTSLCAIFKSAAYFCNPHLLLGCEPILSYLQTRTSKEVVELSVLGENSVNKLHSKQHVKQMLMKNSRDRRKP